MTDAARRLDQALSRLETSLSGREAPAAAAPSDDRAHELGAEQQRTLERERASLVSELSVARDRERELLEAAAVASAALGRAAAEVRAALGEDLGEEEAA